MYYSIRNTVLMAIFCGIICSFEYVNPYLGNIGLSELVLQLSGSRGDFSCSYSFNSMIGLTMRLLPYYLFMGYYGVEVYKNFCTASVYIFSRHPKRSSWYKGECCKLFSLVTLYQAVFMLVIIATSIFRVDVIIDLKGILLALAHSMVFILWCFTSVLLMNIIAIKAESNMAYLLVYGVQMVFTAGIACTEIIEKKWGEQLAAQLLLCNPIAHLVLSWHASAGTVLGEVLLTGKQGFVIGTSIGLFGMSSIITIGIGFYVVIHHDLLVSNIEEG